MRWGTITGVSPLRVRLDGDTDPLPFTPDSLVDPLILEVNDRVRCEISGRVVIVGKAGGTPFPIASDTAAGIVELATPAETITGTADNLAVTPEGLAAWGERDVSATLTVGSKWSLSGNTELRVKSGVATLVFDLTATDTSSVFDPMLAFPAVYSLAGTMGALAYRPSDGTFHQVRIIDEAMEVMTTGHGSGTRLVGAATWVI